MTIHAASFYTYKYPRLKTADVADVEYGERELISDQIFDSSLLSLGVVISATGEKGLFSRSRSKWLSHSAFFALEAWIPGRLELPRCFLPLRSFLHLLQSFDSLEKSL